MFRRSSNARRGRDAGFLVAERSDAAVENAVVNGLPKSWQTAPSMTAAARPRSRPSIRLRASIDHHQRVNPDVALGMPLRFLRAADERVHLRPEPLDDAELQRERETDATARGLQQQLLDFAPDALGRQIVERNARQDRVRLRVHVQVEPRGELQRAQHAQAVVAERRRIDDAQAPVAPDPRGRRTDRGSRRSAGRARSR